MSYLAGILDSSIPGFLQAWIQYILCCRYTGFWWRPETASTTQSRSYSVLYEELDEKAVEIVQILGFSSTSPDTK